MTTSLLKPTAQDTKVDLAEWSAWARFETLGDPALENMLAKAAAWRLAVTAKESPRWLSLVGATGTGKTHLAMRLWKSLRQRQDFNNHRITHYPTWIHWPTFISELKDGAGYGFFRSVFDWPFAAIDDIGAERDTSGFAAEKLCNLLSRREKKWTIITSNLSLAEISAIDRRIADRMLRGESTVVDVRAKSYSVRKMKGQEQ